MAFQKLTNQELNDLDITGQNSNFFNRFTGMFNHPNWSFINKSISDDALTVKYKYSNGITSIFAIRYSIDVSGSIEDGPFELYKEI